MPSFVDGEVLTASDLNAALAAAGASATAAATAASAAVPASSVGQPGGPAGPLSSGSTLPLGQLGLKAGQGITIGSDGTVSAEAQAPASQSSGYDAYVVFQAYNVDSSGNNVGGGPVVLASKGVSGVDSKGAGIYQVNLSPAAPSSHYLVTAFAKFDEAANDGTLAIVSEPRTTAGNPTSTVNFLQITGGYQGSSTSVGLSLFLYRIGINFV